MPNGKGGEPPDKWQVKKGRCPNCGQHLSIRNYDKFLKCHRCHDYLAGLPILRWITHPTWIIYYLKHPSITIRDGIRLIFLIVLIAWLLPSTTMLGSEIGGAPTTDIPDAGSELPIPQTAPTESQQEESEATEDMSSFNRTKVERFVWEYTNKERTERGLEPVEYAPRIVEPAREHSQNMARHDYVGHTEPNGETGEERYEEVCDYSGTGYTYGENAISGWYDKRFRAWKTEETRQFDTEEDLARYFVRGWMLSEGHRENILTSSWEELGVGVHKRDDGKVFASQTFC